MSANRQDSANLRQQLLAAEQRITELEAEIASTIYPKQASAICWHGPFQFWLAHAAGKLDHGQPDAQQTLQTFCSALGIQDVKELSNNFTAKLLYRELLMNYEEWARKRYPNLEIPDTSIVISQDLQSGFRRAAP
jgi:hypothetical protein